MSVFLKETSAAVVQENLPGSASLTAGVLHRLVRNPLAVVSMAVLFFVLAAATIIPFVSPYRFDVHTNDILVRSSAAHWLGTDDSGYDLLVRLAVGGRISLFVGVGVEILSVVIGISVGLLAGYYGGWWDTALMRFTDMMFAFPDILLAILIMAVLAPSETNIFSGLSNVFAALVVTGWPSLARLVRGQTMALRQREFIEAARALGVPNGQIMFKHILPNLLSPLVVAATIDIAGVIVAESTLSFLGIGVPSPLPSWGSLIASPLESGYWRDNPQLVLYPALCLTLTVLAFNFLGDALRDALDPRSN